MNLKMKMKQHKMKRNKNNMILGHDDEEDEVQEEEEEVGWESSFLFQERNKFKKNHSLTTDTIF